LDDPNNVKDGESEVERTKTNNIIAGGWSSRVNRLDTDIKLLVQQRIHADDVSGNIMRTDLEGEWTKLILPMEYEPASPCRTIYLPSSVDKPWEDPRKEAGEVICPIRFSPKALKRLKQGLGSEYRIAGQLQQRPSPEKGGIFKKDYFCKWTKPKMPFFKHIIQSWDTAFTKRKENTILKVSYSACTTWGLFVDELKKPRVMLLSRWQDQVDYPELRHLAQKMAVDYRDDGTIDIKPDTKYRPSMILVENKASGQSIIPDLQSAGISVIGFNPTPYGDKVNRAEFISAYVENGSVYLPTIEPHHVNLKPFADKFIEEAAEFPNGQSSDVIDTFTQVMIRLIKSGYLTHTLNPEDDDLDDYTPKRFY
jgi:predicted phage terminase large subunit-like protein